MRFDKISIVDRNVVENELIYLEATINDKRGAEINLLTCTIDIKTFLKKQLVIFIERFNIKIVTNNKDDKRLSL